MVAPQTRTIGGTLEFSFALPKPANTGGGPNKRRKSSNSAKGKPPRVTTKKSAKPSTHTKPAESAQSLAKPTAS